ncbi:proclotting enzyme-like isoform X2 [Paramacrobiotus metropolitanus]|uniref:proclotting enzyme-like isoform X2 n=1 Tax=Paramacrobiotus metropolitanus TaxID=2943436 RepID=UPI0024463E0A|nr:proclotting enzyme-like isoform X2 [Paramacrobiotus metropolitanus]
MYCAILLWSPVIVVTACCVFLTTGQPPTPLSQHDGHQNNSMQLANANSNALNREKRIFPANSNTAPRKYSSWTKWSQCARNCEQKRFRTCLGTDEKDCPHGPLQMQSRHCKRCHNGPKSKPTHHQVDDVVASNSLYEEFFFTSWSRWSQCHKKDCKQYRWKLCAFYPICGERLMVQQRTCPERVWHVCAEKPESPSPTISHRNGSESDSDFDDNIVVDTKSNLTCGISLARATNVTKKILGGKASMKGKWPFQVIILNHYMENYCAGTLISNWVVTAAHCVKRRMFVKLGEHNIFTDEETEQLFRPTRVIIHPNFDEQTVENDIALLKIADNIKWGTNVLPACLPEKTDDPLLQSNQSLRCVVLGWGKRKPVDMVGSDVLREAEVDIVDQQRCVDAYTGDHVISPRMMCAGGGRSGKGDTCEGDSGGPLLCRTSENDTEGPWKLMGITSFGDGCGKRDKFGVYTRVVSFLDWIEKNTAK